MDNFDLSNKIPLIRVRACMQCKEYVEINPGDPESQKLIYFFEKKHRTHDFLITKDLEDVKEDFICIKRVI